MTSFLSRLADRATLRAPVLERRARSFFEPVTSALDAPAAAAREVRGPEAEATLKAPARAARREEANRRSGSAVPARAASVRAMTAFAASAMTAAPARPAAAGASLRGGVVPERDGALTSARAAAVIAPGVLTSARVLARSAAPPVAAATTLAARASREAASHEGAPPRLSAPRNSTRPALIAQAQAAARATRPAELAASPSPVHVTIGRIEVRAAEARVARPPVRRASPGPKLSLDDYLQGRRRGAR